MPSVFLYSILMLLCWLLSGCSGKDEDQGKEGKARKKETKALTLIRNDDCLNCHSIEDKSVGPSYVKIAQRYEADFSTVNSLANKIIEGGGGLWGGGQMTEHPFLKKEKAKKIVRWILSLDDTVAHQDPMVSTPGVMLTKAFQADQHAGETEKGLAIKAYALEELEVSGTDGFPGIPQNVVPVDSGVVQTIHFPEQESFEPLQKGFVLQATGFITIKQRGKYFFKQVRAGKGRVFLNGEVIINQNDWDRETDIDLFPGTYPITVEYLAEQENKALSLQWITPEDDYYQIIPAEVFTLTN